MKIDGFDIVYTTVLPRYRSEFIYDTKEEARIRNTSQIREGVKRMQGKVVPYVDLPSVVKLLSDVLDVYGGPMMSSDERRAIMARVKALQDIAGEE